MNLEFARGAARRVGSFLSSMTGRIFIILTLGMIVAASIAASITITASDKEFERQLLERTTDEMQSDIELLNAVPQNVRTTLLNGRALAIREQPPSARGRKDDVALQKVFTSRGGLIATARAQFADWELCFPELSTLSDEELERLWTSAEVRSAMERLTKLLPFYQDYVDITKVYPPKCRLISVTLNDGTPLRFASGSSLVERERIGLLNPAFIALLSLSIGILAYVVARIASAPLKSLSTAAAELGMDLDREPVKLSGPTEVRRAAEAFNAMQRRLQQHVGERTRMLAAITHDLQTPLTRLRLRLERVDDESLRERLISDMAAMNALIAEGLELARSADTSEPRVMLDLDSLCQSLVEDAVDAGGDAAFEGECGVVLPLRPLAVRRLFSNLIDNALKYGGSAVVSATKEQEAVCVRIRDRGPGLPPDGLERVFEPFVRLEESRSRQSGGAGLGLTIARTLAEKNGARLSLRNHPDGGLEAIVRWPAPHAR